MVSKWNTVAQQYSENTSLHGFLELAQIKHYVWKLIWLLMMLAVLALCIFMLADLAKDIAREPKTTSITESEDFDEEPTMLIIPQGSGEIYKPVELPPLDLNEIRSLSWPAKPSMDDVDAIRVEVQREIMFKELFFSISLIEQEAKFLDGSISLFDFVKNKVFNKIGTVDDSLVESLLPLLGLRHMDTIPRAEVYEFYDNLVPDNFVAALNHTVLLVHGDEQRMPTLVRTRFGLGYQLKLGIEANGLNALMGERQKSENLISINCGALGISSILYGIGDEYEFLDISPPNHEFCGDIKETTIRLQTKSYHPHYCNDDIETGCITGCLLRHAREQKTCLPFLGIHNLSDYAPICTIESSYYEISRKTNCFQECEATSLWRKCKILTVADQFEGQGDKSTEGPGDKTKFRMTVTVDLAHGLELVHLEPKYSTSMILGSVGGIVGIGFGMSIMSIMQILYYCCMLAKGKGTSVSEATGADNASSETQEAAKTG